MGDLSSTLNTVFDVAADPYLPEVICRVKQLTSIDHGQSAGTCAVTNPGVTGGMGLRRVLPALRAYVYAQQNPWVYPVAVAAILAIPMWVGYELARGRS